MNPVTSELNAWKRHELRYTNRAGMNHLEEPYQPHPVLGRV
jgi:hypothetical protein